VDVIGMRQSVVGESVKKSGVRRHDLGTGGTIDGIPPLRIFA
jgi:hypothetical protein